MLGIIPEMNIYNAWSTVQVQSFHWYWIIQALSKEVLLCQCKAPGRCNSSWHAKRVYTLHYMSSNYIFLLVVHHIQFPFFLFNFFFLNFLLPNTYIATLGPSWPSQIIWSIISDDQLGPLVALKSSWNRPACISAEDL